jgi:hypothetical protein
VVLAAQGGQFQNLEKRRDQPFQLLVTTTTTLARDYLQVAGSREDSHLYHLQNNE